jgi:hypothetical protein
MSSKISALSLATDVQSGDYLAGLRGTGNYRFDPTGVLSNYLGNNTSSTQGYSLNTGAFVYNSGDLALAVSHNGKTIISTNTTGVLYTVASGLTSGFGCQIIQYGTGTVTLTGAAGTSVNSYGGLNQIAGRYGAAYVQWVLANQYVLAGNLS